MIIMKLWNNIPRKLGDIIRASIKFSTQHSQFFRADEVARKVAAWAMDGVQRRKIFSKLRRFWSILPILRENNGSPTNIFSVIGHALYHIYSFYNSIQNRYTSFFWRCVVSLKHWCSSIMFVENKIVLKTLYANVYHIFIRKISSLQWQLL